MYVFFYHSCISEYAPGMIFTSDSAHVFTTGVVVPLNATEAEARGVVGMAALGAVCLALLMLVMASGVTLAVVTLRLRRLGRSQKEQNNEV